MIYTLYKYSDIQKQWIIWEGYLNYRYDQIKLFSISQFAIYYVILAKIPIKNDKEIMAMYLYRNLKQKPSNFFQLNEYEGVCVQCPKSIKSKYFLFKLVGKDQNEMEIFGANNANDREEWIQHIKQALTCTTDNLISDDQSIDHSDRQSWKEDLQKMENVDADVRSHYEPFTENQRLSLPTPSNSFILPHRPAPPIPEAKPSNFKEKQSLEMHRSVSCDTPSSTGNIYLSAKAMPSSLIEDKSREFQSNLRTQTIDGEINHSESLEDRLFTWDDIFYLNELDDHARVLSDIGQIGTFLIRPHLKKNKFNDHQYALSIYTFGGIIKYKILKLSNGEFGLVSNYSQPSFIRIPDLCQYYTNHSLPRSLLHDDFKKGPIENICLRWPYTYYSIRSNKF